MSTRIIEIGSNGKHLSVYRGFLKISEGDREVTRVPLGDICSVVVAGFGITYSNDLIVRLAAHNIWLVACGTNYQPAAWLWPAVSHSIEAQRIDLQTGLSKPRKKQIWADIVRCKIRGQIEVLTTLNKPTERLKRLESEVRSGDEGNREATAAQVYWPLLFGPTFRRNRDMPGVNAALNYGYTILRACVCRAITGAGLHPNIPLHHTNKYSSFRLADDLMEVFRPAVDLHVANLNVAQDELSSDSRASLAALVDKVVLIGERKRTILDATQDVAHSLVSVCAGETPRLTLPSSLRLQRQE